MAPVLKVLVIEPDDIHRHALAEQFAHTAGMVAECLPDPPEGMPDCDVAVVSGPAATALPDRNPGFPVIRIGAETGGEDVLHRPFRFAELVNLLRITNHRHLRSEEGWRDLGVARFQPAAQIVVFSSGPQITLTDREASILSYLHRAGGRAVSRDELLAEVFGFRSGVTTHTVESHVYRLRQKLDGAEGGADLLRTTDEGYVLAAP